MELMFYPKEIIETELATAQVKGFVQIELGVQKR
jgi:hypothetical protein